MSALFALSPLDGRYAPHVTELTEIFSEAALMKFRTHVEVEWMIFMIHHKIIPDCSLNNAEISSLRNLYKNFSTHDAIAIKKIENTVNHDVKAIEYFLQECSAHFPFSAKIKPFWHFCCTSEDINNLAYGLMIKTAIETVILPMWKKINIVLKKNAQLYAAAPLLAHTHGQPASPTTIGKEFNNFAYRISRQIQQLEKQDVLGKFHGAVGNFNAHVVVLPDLDWPELAEQFVQSLGLQFNPVVTQIEPHDFIAEISQNIIRFNTVLLGLNRDMWHYISFNYFKLNVVENEVGSSTMPHKVNPIDFENAEGNLGIANAFLNHFVEKLPISRLQRDLSDSTVLRNLGSALAYGQLAYSSLLKGLNKTTPDLAKIEADLSNHYEVLTEAIQTVLRYYHVDNAYEKIKAASRGHAFTKENYLHCVENLPIPVHARKKLAELTPGNYIGLAKRLSVVTIQ